MEPKYSVLIAGFKKDTFYDDIVPLMHDGIKVFWFSDGSDNDFLKGKYQAFYDIRMLQLYRYNTDFPFTIIDGEIGDNKVLFDKLCESVPEFNSAQFLVEHYAGEHLIVRASAGTGKTAVMIDRIMYLLHAKNANPSDIVMITFTNKATEEMGRRIQETVEGRYRATGHVRYMRMLEQISELTICTIDSLSTNLLRKLGYNIGFSAQPSLRSHNQDIREIIISLVDAYHNGSGVVKSKLGLSLHEMSRTAFEFLMRISALGMSANDLAALDWGIAPLGDANKIQRALKFVVENLDEQYDKLKREQDSISLSDLTREANAAIFSAREAAYRVPRYMFVDEFQDTNLEQIALVNNMVTQWGVSAFVVGDSKQSIYRFRGADDSAFDTLKLGMINNGANCPEEFELMNNYRTSPEILDRLDKLFRKWVRDGLLNDFHRLVPCVQDVDGELRVRNSRPWAGDVLVKDIAASVRDLEMRISAGYASPDSKVAVLVRTNSHVDMVAELCEGKVPIIAKKDRPLFLSDAVRDFFSMVRSYVYPNEPSAVFDYLLSPYSTITEPLSIEELLELNGDRVILNDLLLYYDEMTNRQYYARRFMERPALSVIWEMLDDIPVVDNYIAMLKFKGETDESLLKDAARAYKANLDKLMVILYRNTSGDSLSLYRMMEYLEIAISTNRDEKEADVEPESTAVCMTIHSAKGLEFDTVIVPTTSFIEPPVRSEVLVSQDRARVGWRYFNERDSKSTIYENDYFKEVKDEDDWRYICEETRVLYVALTRAKHTLVVYATPSKTSDHPSDRILEGI